MMRRLTLRARLTLLTAVTVALTVTGAAVAGWFLTKSQLYNQLDSTLSTMAPGPGGGPGGPQGHDQQNGGRDDVFELALARCGSNTSSDSGNGRVFERATQVITQQGKACPMFNTATIVVTGEDVAVAKGDRPYVHRDGVTSTGVRMRVYTRSDPQHPGYAISTAEQLGPTLDRLDTLALWLIGLSVLGIAVATTVGMLIARASLKPVDQLTDTVEHIAKSEDLDTRIPVEGKDEIARLSRSFNTMTTSLAAARDHQRRLIADAGHELRTPLTSLRTNIDLLMKSEDTGRPLPPETRSRLLTSVKAQLQELSSLVGDLLELARPDQKQPPVEVVALHEVVEHAVERARLRGPGLRVQDAIAPWYVKGDPGTLERAMVNLLDNAVKFSPPDGVVEVRLADGVLTVRDQGPGIPAEDLPHVFERFWRSPSARSLPGSGLGLSIVARVVQEAGGEVRLEPASGGGTLAVIRLPGGPGI